MNPDLTTIFIGLSALGVVLLFLGFSGSVLNFRKDESKDERIAFFRKVEEAREQELLEKKPVQYDVSGIWRGIGASYFGIGRNIEFDLRQHHSEVTGTLSDNYGTCTLQGYFVWPYIWFDVKRDVTVFEFRGTVKESAEGSAIEGSYRYLSSDAPWTVSQIARYTDDGTKGESAEDASESSSDEPPSDADGEASADTPKAAAVASSVKSKDRGTSTTSEIELGGPSRFGNVDPGKCLDCGQELEEMLSFCIYCGRKKGAV